MIKLCQYVIKVACSDALNPADIAAGTPQRFQRFVTHESSYLYYIYIYILELRRHSEIMPIEYEHILIESKNSNVSILDV